MKSIAVLLLSIALFGAGRPSAYACSCADPSEREKYRKADCVFLGQVIGIADSNVEEFVSAVKFRVEKRWKGARAHELIVNFTFDTPGWCGDLNLTEGKSFLIYAYRQGQDLISYTDCGPNLQGKYAARSVKKLDRLWYRLFAQAFPF